MHGCATATCCLSPRCVRTSSSSSYSRCSRSSRPLMPRARSQLSSHAPRSSSTQCASAALPSRSSPQHALTSLYPAPCQSAGQIRGTRRAACAPTVGGRAAPRRATALRVVLAGRGGREFCLSNGLPPHGTARHLRGLYALSGRGGARLSGGGRGVPPPHHLHTSSSIFICPGLHLHLQACHHLLERVSGVIKSLSPAYAPFHQLRVSSARFQAP